jgi:hypothetical protein
MAEWKTDFENIPIDTPVLIYDPSCDEEAEGDHSPIFMGMRVVKKVECYGQIMYIEIVEDMWADFTPTHYQFLERPDTPKE